ncbi:chlorophyll a/b-binding protein [Gloeobacter violaceus]|uniref:CAB/ELIP/HLIP superfamily protein n=1 Tax=Gloeobacter violaceus (strain ATCC 29082 / PCC 7421) TaxID=251221 RepID=Q7NMM3_GLOVI|nr:chlorophyll a/b-binding protein [Gloeobacter violaceus]BAC88683.1 CAB/ELIP/HLIP superfamily protein [Gloeobacter violaceus PCC 7421]
MMSGQDNKDKTITADPLDPARDRNEFRLGWTPQAEIWNGRFAMIGFVAYLLWDLAGYSVVRDVLNIASGTGFPR